MRCVIIRIALGLLCLAVTVTARAETGITAVGFDAGSGTPDADGNSLGWMFTPNTNITVTDLGFLNGLVTGGSAGTQHAVGIYDTTSKTLLGTTTVANGASGDTSLFKYSKLNTPITLLAGTQYTIAGVTNGDRWLFNTANLTHASQLSCDFMSGPYHSQTDATLNYPDVLFPYPSMLTSGGFFGPNMKYSTATVALGNIMAMGDSITEGNTAGVGYIAGGYRQSLYAHLTGDGLAPKFVGSSTTNSTTTLTATGNAGHNGYSGYRIDQIDNGVLNQNWMSTDPNIVLLQIGTNDIAQGYSVSTAADRLDTLLGDIIAKKPNARIVVSKIPGGLDATFDAQVKSFNAAVAQKVASRAQAGQTVSMVDMYSEMNYNKQTNAQGQTLYADTWHPNQTGFNLMGAAWAGAVETLPINGREVAAMAFTQGSGSSGGNQNSMGWSFTVNKEIAVTKLGFLNGAATGGTPGNSHLVGIYDDTTHDLLASVQVANGEAGSTEQFEYALLDTPLYLQKGKHYVVAGVTNGDAWFYNVAGLAYSSEIALDASVGRYINQSDSTLNYPVNIFDSGTVQTGFFGANFQYVLVPEPGAFVLLLSGAIAVFYAIWRRRPG
jgi:acyl-CoA thioesterase I